MLPSCMRARVSRCRAHKTQQNVRTYVCSIVDEHKLLCSTATFLSIAHTRIRANTRTFPFPTRRDALLFASHDINNSDNTHTHTHTKLTHTLSALWRTPYASLMTSNRMCRLIALANTNVHSSPQLSATGTTQHTHMTSVTECVICITHIVRVWLYVCVCDFSVSFT